MKGFFGNLFDMNNDGKIEGHERFMDFMLFNDLMRQANKEEDEDEEDEEDW